MHWPPAPWKARDEDAQLTWVQALDRMSRARILCLGELHDRADIHLWQRNVIEGLLPFRPRIALGLEMLPRSAQPALDAWVEGKLSYPDLLEATDWDRAWGYDAALYAPVFTLARDRGLPLRALNVERGLSQRVGREDWGAVPVDQREGQTPPAPASSAYRSRLYEMTGGAREGRASASPEDPAFDSFVRAQLVWDRAFAHGLIEALELPGDPLVIGLTGRGHLERDMGVPAQLSALGQDAVQVAMTLDAGEPEGVEFADLLCRLPARPI